MYLCRSPLIAGSFWGDIISAQRLGIQVKKDIVESLADQNQCMFVASENLKPIDFVAGELAITDGSVKGWADPHLYILYINRPNN